MNDNDTLRELVWGLWYNAVDIDSSEFEYHWRRIEECVESEQKRTNLDWRIEQWRRAKKYMLNDKWQPIFDELCDLKVDSANRRGAISTVPSKEERNTVSTPTKGEL